MDEPKFKGGEAVQYEGMGDVMHVVHGPLAPIRFSSGDPLFRNRRDEYCYLVDSGPSTRLVPEGRLTRAEEWVACPGKHRIAAHHGWTPGREACYGMERLVGSER